MFYTNVSTRGNDIMIRGVKNGKRFQQRVPFKPTLYARSSTETGWKSILGDNVGAIKFNNITDAREYVKRYSDVSNFPIYGNTNYNYQFITKAFPNDITFDMSHMLIYTIDIETTTEHGFPDPKTANEEVLLISVQNYNTKRVTTFGCRPITSHSDNVTYVLCKDEMQLLQKFVGFIQGGYPDIITGWNCGLFDIPYLSARIIRVLGETSLKQCSPWYAYSVRTQTIGGREQLIYDWTGISLIDYLDLYRKFSYKSQESYKLDYIAQEELGKAKIKSKYSTFKEFYTNDWELFVDYNILDVQLVDQLEDKMKLIELILTMAYDAKCNYGDIFSSVRTWDCILYNVLHKRNIVLHQHTPPEGDADRMIMGAYVKEPTPGLYDWVVSFDATSLYPSIIMSLNMSPETLVDGEKVLGDTEESIRGLLNRKVDTGFLKSKDYSMAANGQCFRRDVKGIFPQIIEHYFKVRQTTKRQMLSDQAKYEETKDPKYLKHVTSLHAKQMAAKILMNSLYGAMGNIFFRFYDTRLAEGITMTGQLVIRSVAERLNDYLNDACKTQNTEYSFYCDTDSVYITMGNYVNTHFGGKTKNETVAGLDQLCGDKIERVISAAVESLGSYVNTYQPKLIFKREVIADRGVWIAKKRYALNVYNSEGIHYSEPKLKVMGLEIVRSSTPAPVRIALKDAVAIVLREDESTLRAYVKQLESVWYSKSAEEIAFPRSVNNIKKYTDSGSLFRKGTPIHVAGALVYNFLIEKHNLQNKYQKIQEGDKIKFVYLKEPNPIGTHAITFMGELAPELELDRYIDYEVMFNKAFLDPLNTLLNCVGWKLKEQPSLESLFV